MATKKAQPPRGGAKAVQQAAIELLPVRFPNQAHADVAAEVSEPIAVLNLGLDALLKNAGLEAATLTGWRYVVSLGGEPVALADTDPGANAVVRQLNYGPFVTSVKRGVERSERALSKTGGELRLLQVPALYVVALWHHQKDGDTVSVLAPAPPPFEAGVQHDADEFLKTLHQAARAVGPEGSARSQSEGSAKKAKGSGPRGR